MNKSKLTEVSMIALSDYTLTIHAKKRQEERIDNLTHLGYSVGNPYKLFTTDNKGYMITDKGFECMFPARRGTYMQPVN